MVLDKNFIMMARHKYSVSGTFVDYLKNQKNCDQTRPNALNKLTPQLSPRPERHYRDIASIL